MTCAVCGTANPSGARSCLHWAVALAALDQLELLGPGHPDVRGILPEARAILEGLGARPHLTRLDAALARTPVTVEARTADGTASATAPA